MGMTLKRLDVLVKLAETRADAAAESLARARATFGEHQARLGELQRYAVDYRHRPLPVSTALIINRERFLARLQEAEQQQRRTVERAGEQVRESTRHWLDQRSGQQRFDLLKSAAHQRDRSIEADREQKQLDEFALRGHTHALADGAH